MKIFYTSDLHFDTHSCMAVETHPFKRIGVDLAQYDGIIIAGDLTTRGDPATVLPALEEIKAAGIPAVIVLGNHDHYGRGYYYEAVSVWDAFLRENDLLDVITLLHANNGCTKSCGTFLKGVLVVGGTLWTDVGKKPEEAALVDARMPDSTYIGTIPGSREGFRAKYSYLEHVKTKDAIQSRVYQEIHENGYSGPIILVTHHVPTREGIHPTYLGKDDSSFKTIISRGYFSDCEAWLAAVRPTHIICGHTHRSLVKMHSTLNIPIHLNAYGYPDEYIAGELFSPDAYLEV